MKKLIFPLLLVAVMCACTDKNKLPKDVLTQPKMQAVMWDLMRAGDFLNNYVLYRDTGVNKIAESQKWNEKVFRIHKITREQFDKSYKYYREHPQMMKVVMDSISKIQIQAPPPPKPFQISSADSLKNKMDSLKEARKGNRFNRLGRQMPKVKQ